MHSFITDAYEDPSDDGWIHEKGRPRVRRRCKWEINHNNESHPDSPVHVSLIEIDGERLKLGDDQIQTMVLPFGVLAEFVGMRVLRDKISKLEQIPSRHILGLEDQGGYVVRD